MIDLNKKYQCYFSPKKTLKRFAVKKNMSFNDIIYNHMTNSQVFIGLMIESDYNNIMNYIKTHKVTHNGKVLNTNQIDVILFRLKEDREYVLSQFVK